MKKITSVLSIFLMLIAAQGFSQSPDITELLERFEQHKNSPGSAFEFFTVEELQMIGAYLSSANSNGIEASMQLESGGATGYGWESQGLGYGSYDTNTPNPFTTIAAGSGTPNFESSGAIDPNDNATAIVMDNAGDTWSVDVASGVYTFLGNVGIADAVGLEFNSADGTLYLATTTELFTIDPAGPTATSVGFLNTSGAVAIALAIDDTGTGYTYDIADDTFYTVDLATGAATAVGNIGFDASFGQGMFWDSSSGNVYMAALNAGAGNLGELRIVDVATGGTTLVGEWEPGVVRQMAWSTVANPPLSIDENVLSQISIFPNPATDMLNVKIPAGIEIQSVVMYDVLGKRVNVQMNNGQINVSNLSRGVYILSIHTNAGALTEKIVRQ